MRGFVLLLTSIVVALLVAGCAAAATPTPPPPPTPTKAVAPAATAAATVVAPAARPTVPPGQKELTIITIGGGAHKTANEQILKMFAEKYNVKVNLIAGGSGTENITKVEAEKARPTIDIVGTNDSGLVIGKQRGVLEKIDGKRVTNVAKIHDVMKDPDGYGIPQGIGPVGIQYNTKIFQEKGFPKPTSWYDLWKPEYKGHVALMGFQSSITYMLIPQLAKDLSGDSKKVDLAFSKFKELSPNVFTILPSVSAFDDVFKSGDAWIGNFHLPGTLGVKNQGFPVEFVFPKEGAPFYTNLYAAVKDAPHPELAQEFLQFYASKEAQTITAEVAAVLPGNKDVVITDEMKKKIGFGLSDIGKLVATDFNFVVPSLKDWTERWNKEVEVR